MMMTSSQQNTIVELTRELGIGSRADQGIKHVLGKMPVKMSASRADSVINALREELGENEDDNLGYFGAEDAPVRYR